MKGMWIAYTAVGCMTLASVVVGQEKGEADRPQKVITPLKVQIVMTKQLGEKKVSRLPYAFPCNAVGGKSTLKLGVEIPVPVRKADKVEFLYRNVGTNIECEASALPSGHFNLQLTIEQTSLYSTAEKAGSSVGEQSLERREENPTVFRLAMSQFNAVLRDGQTTQAVLGTDPVTGEIVTVDVTLAVVK